MLYVTSLAILADDGFRKKRHAQWLNNYLANVIGGKAPYKLLLWSGGEFTVDVMLKDIARDYGYQYGLIPLNFSGKPTGAHAHRNRLMAAFADNLLIIRSSDSPTMDAAYVSWCMTGRNLMIYNYTQEVLTYG